MELFGNFLKNVTIKKKLMIMIGFISLLLVGVGILGISGINATNNSLQTVYNDRVVPLRDLKIISDMYSINIIDTSHRVRNGYMLWADGRKNIDEAKKTISEKWDAYLKTIKVDEEKKIVDEIELVKKKTDASIEKLRGIMQREDMGDLYEYIHNEVYSVIDPVSAKIAELVLINVQLLAAQYDHAVTSYKIYRVITVFSILSGLLLTVMVAFRIIRSIMNQQVNLTKKTSRIVDSDLFTGLSNFLPAEIANGTAYIEGAADYGPVTSEVPARIKDERVTLACRPSEIDFVKDKGLRGLVKRKVYLGDVIDYDIAVNNVEIRVQVERKKGMFNEGDECYLKFNRLRWYPAIEME